MSPYPANFAESPSAPRDYDAALTLPPHEVHVWRAPLAWPAAVIESMATLLAPGEAVRAARFQQVAARDRFIAARAILRMLLAGYLGTGAGTIKLGYGRHGKPLLGGSSATTGITFNLSHTDDRALFAIARGRAVGIDLEPLRIDLAPIAIAEKFFAAGEISRLARLSSAARVIGFGNCWCRKEAYLKARGDGLALPLDSFEVTLAPGEPAALLHAAPHDTRRWHLRELAIPGFTAALAAEDNGCPLTVRDWVWSRASATTESRPRTLKAA